jgi:AcrR family transcriptional regulator
MTMSARGRPRSFDRTAALAAATQLFWRKGYSATSIAELCAVMGIGSPSLYAAFGSKQALYLEALSHYEATQGPLIWFGLRRAATAREAVEDFLMASAAVLPAKGRPGGCMVTLSAVGEEDAEALRDRLVAGRAEALSLLEARLARGVAEGELPAGTDRKALARFYLGVQQGMSVQARDGADSAELEAVARMAMAAWPSPARG